MKPTSAISFNSSITFISSPFLPGSANVGACLTEFLNFALPLPPLPPLAMMTSSPSFFKSIISPFELNSLTSVPTGTLSIMSSPSLPYCNLFLPFSPLSALNILLCLKSISVLIFESAFKIMDAPLPPSPP